jgi:arsenate reductase
MAEGILNSLYGDRYNAHSAGTQPTVVNPYAIKTMAEINIDISHHKSKGIEEFRNASFDYVVTVCDRAKETCPFFPGAKEYIHKGFEDPSKVTSSPTKAPAVFKRLRDDIAEWIKSTFGKS